MKIEKPSSPIGDNSLEILRGTSCIRRTPDFPAIVDKCYLLLNVVQFLLFRIEYVILANTDGQIYVSILIDSNRLL